MDSLENVLLPPRPEHISSNQSGISYKISIVNLNFLQIILSNRQHFPPGAYSQKYKCLLDRIFFQWCTLGGFFFNGVY